tara:strand:- start:350 stop:697 length:348 start_codon:yes stop_codon:yes gene_type:complete
MPKKVVSKILRPKTVRTLGQKKQSVNNESIAQMVTSTFNNKPKNRRFIFIKVISIILLLLLLVDLSFAIFFPLDVAFQQTVLYGSYLIFTKYKSIITASVMICYTMAVLYNVSRK